MDLFVMVTCTLSDDQQTKMKVIDFALEFREAKHYSRQNGRKNYEKWQIPGPSYCKNPTFSFVPDSTKFVRLDKVVVCHMEAHMS